MVKKAKTELEGLQVEVSKEEAKAFMSKRMGRLKNSLTRFFLKRFGENGPNRIYELKAKAKGEKVPYLSFGFLCRYFVDQFGDDGLFLLSEILGEMIPKEAEEVRDILKIGENDAIAAARILSYAHTCGGVQGEITEATPEKAVRTEWFCPIKDEVKREYGEKAISLPMIAKLAKSINPNLEVSHPKYLCGGDDRCELVFTIRK
jgi:hypothetical protein